jgi:hypothetical protein
VKIFTILLQWKIATINAGLINNNAGKFRNLAVEFEKNLDRAWIFKNSYSGTPQCKNSSTSFLNSNQFIKKKIK